MSRAVIIPFLKTDRVTKGQTEAELEHDDTLRDEAFHCVIPLYRRLACVEEFSVCHYEDILECRFKRSCSYGS